MSEKATHNDANGLDMAMAAINSEDVLTQNRGVEAVIRIGKAGVPRLLALLEKGGPNRAKVRYALSQIVDARAASVLTGGLGAKDEQVRAYSAQGLARIGDPQAQAAALQTLNDAADHLHADITPSVRTLSGMGLKAIPSLLDLLMAEDEMTRLHAQRALESILARQHGFVPGGGFPSPKAEEETRAEWMANWS